MAKYLVDETSLRDVADDIRAKTGDSSPMTFPTGFKAAIETLVSPSGNQDITTLDEYNVSSKATARVSAAERAKFLPENIADGVTLLGVQGTHQGGTDTSDATATASDILFGKTAYARGSKLVGSIPEKTASDLSAVGAIVSVPAGHYANTVTKTVDLGSVSIPAKNITADPAISVSAGGLITASVSKNDTVSPSVTPGYVSSVADGTILVLGSATDQLPVQPAQTITPTTSDQTIASGKYLTGTQTIKGDANLVAGNIKKDVSIFGVTGTYEGGGGGGIVLPFASGQLRVYYEVEDYVGDGLTLNWYGGNSPTSLTHLYDSQTVYDGSGYVDFVLYTSVYQYLILEYSGYKNYGQNPDICIGGNQTLATIKQVCLDGIGFIYNRIDNNIYLAIHVSDITSAFNSNGLITYLTASLED